MQIPKNTVETPTYDAGYYANYGGSSYVDDPAFLALGHHFADRIVSTLAPTSHLDAGCAIGHVVFALRARGVESYGTDISEYAISRADESIRDFVSVQSLTDPFDRTYDLVTCIEVIEHLPASEAPAAVANLCAASDRILLSSTPYEHEEPTHLNVQPPEYWSAEFARQGFFRAVDFDATFISPWAVLYERRSDDLVERVREYDRSFWRLRDENVRLRTALLQATSGESSSSSAAVQAHDAQIAELEERNTQLEQDVQDARHNHLRAVDESIAEARRAGTALGRVRELEGEVASLRSLADRYNDVVGSTTWRLMWKTLTPYRELRSKLGR